MITAFRSWLKGATRLETSEEGNEVFSRVIFSNVIFISLPIVYLIFIFLDVSAYLTPISDMAFDQIVVPMIIGICILNLWLNHKGWSILARLTFLVLWPLFLHIIPIALLGSPSDYYLAYPFGLVFHSILIQLMFSYKKDRLLFVILLLGNFICLITSVQLLEHFRIGPEMIIVDNKYFLFDSILYWLLFNLVTFYVLYVVETFIQELHKKTKIIREQRDELNSFNQKLESIVEQRTHELEEGNQKLRQYAFYNAHHLRGPFCKIQGFIDVYEFKSLEDDEKQEVRAKITESMNELDETIREIQKLTETKS